MIEKLARAVYDAEDPLSGDTIATVIHMSDHLFWDDTLSGESDTDRQLEAVRIICRAAARAVLQALRDPTPEMIEAGEFVAVRDFIPDGQFETVIWRAMIDAASAP